MRKKGFLSGLSIKKTIVRLDLGYYWIFAALRIVLTLFPQTGYIHPDEYFQTVEVFSGHVFDLQISPPWEYNVTFPLRSVVLTCAFIQSPLYLLKTVAEFMYLFFEVKILTSYTLLVVPRLAMCILSFLSDYCLYKICYLYGQNYKERLIIFASSYVTLVYMTRTFNNCIEVLCFNILLLLVAMCMAESEKINYQKNYLKTKYDTAETIPDKVKITKLIKLLPRHSLNKGLAITFVTVGGIFNRPTFICYAVPPLFFWIQRGMGGKEVSFIKDFHSRTILLALYAIPIVAMFIFIDSSFYGYITWAEVMNARIDFNNFVVTPLNFLKYNINSDNLKDHGLHSRLLHVLINIPLLFNILGVLGLLIIFKMMYRGSCFNWTLLPKPQSITGLMTLSFLFPVTCLSMIPHQEPRFIIPLLLPMVFLYSHLIKDFQEHCTSVVPFRKRFPRKLEVPAGLYTIPVKCVNFVRRLTENFDNRYNVNGRFLTMVKNAENEWNMARQERKKEDEDGNINGKNVPKEAEPKVNKSQMLLRVWFVLNIISVLFFGFIHQGGVYPLAKHLSQELKTKPTLTCVHLVTSHIYSLPQHLLMRKNSYRDNFTQDGRRFKLRKDFFIYEMGSASSDDVSNTLKTILSLSRQRKLQHHLDYKLLYAIPVSLFDEFKHSFANLSNFAVYHIVDVFTPHLSTEAFPRFQSIDSELLFRENVSPIMFNNVFKIYYLKEIFGFLLQFRLVLIQIELK